MNVEDLLYYKNTKLLYNSRTVARQ